MKSFNIAISGACHSGKTTFIDKFKEMASDDVVVNDEVIRHRDIDIDEIRKDPEKYLAFEKEVITEKCQQEAKCLNIENKICLFDRSLIDSYFYYTRYLGASNLTGEQLDDYQCFKVKIEKAIVKMVDEFYDKIVVFNPLSIIHQDPFRPKNLASIQISEYNDILHLTKELCPISLVEEFDSYPEFNIARFISTIQNTDLAASSVFDSYDIYNNLVEKKFFIFNNIVSNTYGSIDYLPSKVSMLNSALLYSTDKCCSDDIINMIKAIRVEPEYMDSRCYPTGLWDKRNVMVVGEAPGKYGRSIKSEYLKPSFIFAKTSWILRSVLNEIFEQVPYITNLLKYARPNNKVSVGDFNQCQNIFINEVNELEPKCMIILGNNAWNYLQSIKTKIPISTKLIKVAHPASILYTWKSGEEYKVDFLKAVKNAI